MCWTKGAGDLRVHLGFVQGLDSLGFDGRRPGMFRNDLDSRLSIECIVVVVIIIKLLRV